MRTWKLYLDDERTPKTPGWTVCRSFAEATRKILVDGPPYEMSLDHDLGENVPTGYDFIKWFFEEFYPVYQDKQAFKRIVFNCHSANPVGRVNIEEYIKCAMKHI